MFCFCAHVCTHPCVDVFVLMFLTYGTYTYTHTRAYTHIYERDGWIEISNRREEMRKGNVLFNDALSTFYLLLYGIKHMVKYSSVVRAFAHGAK